MLFILGYMITHLAKALVRLLPCASHTEPAAGNLSPRYAVKV